MSDESLEGGSLQKGFVAGALAQIRRVFSGKVFVAVGWTSLAMVVSQILRLVGSLIMTRLLAPEMFGIMSIVLSVQITLGLILDVGLRAAIIQSPRGDDPELLNTAWTIQIIRGTIITCITILIALSLPFGVDRGWFSPDTVWAAPELPLVLSVAALSAFIHGFESTNSITAERNLALKRFTILKLSGQLVGFFVMVLIGLLTRSIWALVVSGVLTTLFVTLVSHVFLPGIRNKIAWNDAARAEIAKFGLWVMLSSAATVLSNQADRFVFGGLVDSATLGLYAIALNFALLVETMASTCIWSIFLPALSEARHSETEKFSDKYFKLRQPLDLGVTFVAGGLFASGATVIDILYDDRYLPAGEMLAILSFLLIFSTRYNLAIAAYMALGKPHLTASINLVKCLSLFVFLFVGYQYFGFTGAIAAVSFHTIPAVLMTLWYNHSEGLNNFRFDLITFAVWPIGFGLGLVFNALMGLIIGS